MSRVTVRLKGGLGNQMFQYAAGRAIAMRHGIKIVTLDTSWFGMVDNSSSTTSREFGLDFLGEDKINAFRSAQSRRVSISGKLRSALTNRRLLMETDLLFDQRIARAKPPVILDGYFQSEKYFEDFREEVARDFSVK